MLLPPRALAAERQGCCRGYLPTADALPGACPGAPGSQAVVPVAAELHRLYRRNDPRLCLRFQTADHPWAHVMALLLLAAKLLYGLDGRPRPLLPHLPPPPRDWVEWGRAALGAGPGASGHPLSTEAALELSDPGFERYMQYLRTTVFGAFQPPDDLREHRALFQGLALGPAAPSAAAAAAAAAGGGDDLPLQPQQPQTQQPQTQQQQQQQQQPRTRGRQPTADEARPAGQPAAAAPDASPPAVLACTFFGTTPEVLPPDYAAVLAACAAHVWLTPQSLQKVRGWVRGVPAWQPASRRGIFSLCQLPWSPPCYG